MAFQIIMNAIKEIGILWEYEWQSQHWISTLRVFKNYPQWAWRSHYWNEFAEIIYWEPLYHPIVAIGEARRVLLKINDETFRGYADFVDQMEEGVKACNKVVPRN